MRALTWHGKRDVRVDEVPDPRIEQPTDAIIKVTSTAICGSDLHLYEVLGPFLKSGDILGHEPMGIVEEVGPDVTHIKPGDRVVIPFNISCGSCWMCSRGLFAQCETTQNREMGKGASLLGYTSLYGSVPGGQAEYLRVPQAHFGPIKVPDAGPDEQYLVLSDVIAEPMTDKMAVDRMAALRTAVKSVRRGGTVSVSGVYGGEVDPMPMMEMFDRGITMRLGQCHVKRWVDDILPAVLDTADPLGTLDMTTHHLPLEQAPEGYETFQKKADDCIKVVLKP